MARPLRIQYSGAVYHITSRGNEKKPVFKDRLDRQTFLDILHRVNNRYNWVCHAYCLMDNHFHLLIETPDGNVSLGMRQLNGVYTQAFNRHYRRIGHLFQGRYKAILIEKDEHLLEVSRYIVLNPVRAGAVERPGDWPWSSYRATAGMKRPHPSLHKEWILSQMSNEKGKAERGYRRFVADGLGKESIWAEVKGQVLLGGAAFVGRFREHFQRIKDIPEISRSQRFANRPVLDGIFSKDIKRDIGRRNEKIVEAVEDYGYTQREIADFLGLHFTSISRIMHTRSKC